MVVDCTYYINLLKGLALLAVLSLSAVIGAVLFILAENIYYAYASGKSKGENRQWIYYVKDGIQDFIGVCRDFNWVKQILIFVKKSSAPSDKRPDNDLNSVFFNKSKQFLGEKINCLKNLTHLKRIIRR